MWCIIYHFRTVFGLVYVLESHRNNTNKNLHFSGHNLSRKTFVEDEHYTVDIFTFIRSLRNVIKTRLKQLIFETFEKSYKKNMIINNGQNNLSRHDHAQSLVYNYYTYS